MSKRLLVLSAVVFALICCGVGTRCFAQNASDQLEQADDYLDDGNYVEAEAIYKDVAQEYVGTKYGLKAQWKLACLYIETDRTAEAETAYQGLLVGYAGYGDDNLMADAVDRVADAYCDVKKHDKALEIYSYVVDTWPDSKQAIGSQEDLAKLYIQLGDDSNAEAAVNKLIADFANRDGIADAVHDVANKYRDAKKHEEALQFYKHVVDSWPDSEQAMGSQENLAKLYIELGDDPNAEAAVGKLLGDFANRDRIANSVHEVAEGYRDAKKYEKAFHYYKHAVDSWPEQRQAIWSQAATAKLYIQLGDDPNAEAAVGKLISGFSANWDLPAALNLVGEIYERAGKCEQAKSVYQQVIQQNPDKRLAQRVERAIMRIDLLPLAHSGGDVNSVVEAIDMLIADFNDHPALAKTVFEIADKYYHMGLSALTEAGKYETGPNEPEVARAREYFEKALVVTEKIITEELTESDEDASVEVVHLAAECCHQLGRYGTAMGYYKMVVDNWPEYKYAARALSLVADGYVYLRSTGAIGDAEANAQIEAAYRRLLDQYPDYWGNSKARRWLTWLDDQKQPGEGEKK